MIFDRNSILACVVLPACMAFVAMLILGIGSRRRARTSSSNSSSVDPVSAEDAGPPSFWHRLGTQIAMACFGVAIFLSLWINEGWIWQTADLDWWVFEPWQLLFVPVVLLAALAIYDTAASKAAWRWSVLAIGSAATGWLVSPTADGFANLFTIYSGWIVAVVAVSLLASLAVERGIQDSNGRWVYLIFVAWSGTVFLIAATTNGNVAELALTNLVFAAAVALVNLIYPVESVRSLVFGQSLITTALIYVTRINDFVTHETWFWPGLMALPLIVTSVDRILVGVFKIQNNGLRAVIAAIVSIAIIVPYAMYVFGGSSVEDEWA